LVLNWQKFDGVLHSDRFGAIKTPTDRGVNIYNLDDMDVFRQKSAGNLYVKDLFEMFQGVDFHSKIKVFTHRNLPSALYKINAGNLPSKSRVSAVVAGTSFLRQVGR
jgi:hypothetical protein